MGRYELTVGVVQILLFAFEFPGEAVGFPNIAKAALWPLALPQTGRNRERRKARRFNHTLLKTEGFAPRRFSLRWGGFA